MRHTIYRRAIAILVVLLIFAQMGQVAFSYHQKQKQADRPSLVLCRAGEQDLWTLAKAHGSTVEAIRAANQLEGAPEKGRMLLIPVE